MKECYERQEEVPEEANYLFKETYGELCRRSLQYLKKWVTSYRLVIKKGDDETKHKKRGRRRDVKQRVINNGAL